MKIPVELWVEHGKNLKKIMKVIFPTNMANKTKKYRVKVVVENQIIGSPITKYVIQIRFLHLFWLDYSDATILKDWAYRTCEELNTSYEYIANKHKNNIK